MFGNVLAILWGLADEAATHRIIRAIVRARANDPYPVRVVCAPIPEEACSGGPTCRGTGRTSPGSTITAGSGRSSARSGQWRWRRRGLAPKAEAS